MPGPPLRLAYIPRFRSIRTAQSGQLGWAGNHQHRQVVVSVQPYKNASTDYSKALNKGSPVRAEFIRAFRVPSGRPAGASTTLHDCPWSGDYCRYTSQSTHHAYACVRRGSESRSTEDPIVESCSGTSVTASGRRYSGNSHAASHCLSTNITIMLCARMCAVPWRMQCFSTGRPYCAVAWRTRAMRSTDRDRLARSAVPSPGTARLSRPGCRPARGPRRRRRSGRARRNRIRRARARTSRPVPPRRLASPPGRKATRLGGRETGTRRAGPHC